MQRADLLEPVPVCGLPGRGLPAANTRQTYRVSTATQSQPVEGDYNSKSCGCYAGSLHPAAGCNPSIYGQLRIPSDWEYHDYRAARRAVKSRCLMYEGTLLR